MTTPSIESSFNWDFLELLPCTLRLRLRPTLRWSGSVAVTFASFADELRCIDFRGPTEYGILGFSGAAFGFSSMFLLHPVFSGSSAHAPAANNVRRKPRNTVRGGRGYPDVLITARKGLLDENAFYFAQNGRGIPFRRDRNLRSDRSRNLRSTAFGPAKASGMPKAQMTAGDGARSSGERRVASEGREKGQIPSDTQSKSAAPSVSSGQAGMAVPHILLLRPLRGA